MVEHKEALGILAVLSMLASATRPGNALCCSALPMRLLTLARVQAYVMSLQWRQSYPRYLCCQCFLNPGGRIHNRLDVI